MNPGDNLIDTLKGTAPCPQRGYEPDKRIGLVIMVLGTAIALSLRFIAALDNFWLDEVFTYYLAQNMGSAWDAITKIRIDHHLLNTMYMYLIGNQPAWFWYRLLSVVTGTASVVLLAYISLGSGIFEMIAAVLLGTVSYPLVVYSSEARGYAPAIFFSLLSFIFIQKYWSCRSLANLLLFWASVMLSLLSHAASVCIYISISAWSLYRELRLSKNLIPAARELLKCHLLPVVFLACLYFLVIRKSASIGGAVIPLPSVLIQTLCLAVGSPTSGIWMPIGATLAIACFAMGIYDAAMKQDRSICIFYICGLIVAPALMLLVNNKEYVYPRYFVVLLPFFFLMTSQAFSSLARKNTSGKYLYITVLFLSVLGNGLALTDLFTYGRGGYMQAVQYMAAHTPRDEIIVGGDHDFRNGIMIQFYARYLAPPKHISYIKSDSWPETGPDWAIIHTSPGTGERDPGQSISAKGGRYILVQTYRCCSLSGVNWFIYQNDSHSFSK